eukprot:7828584-Pyramimonas_sp.AAC.1
MGQEGVRRGSGGGQKSCTAKPAPYCSPSASQSARTHRTFLSEGAHWLDPSSFQYLDRAHDVGEFLGVNLVRHLRDLHPERLLQVAGHDALVPLLVPFEARRRVCQKLLRELRLGALAQRRAHHGGRELVRHPRRRGPVGVA